MPDITLSTRPKTARFHVPQEARTVKSFQEYLAVGAAMLGVTLPALFLRQMVGTSAIALVYLLSVVILACFVGRGPTLLAAALSAVSWNLFFLSPHATLRIGNAADAIVLGIYFLVALLVGLLTSLIRGRESAARKRAARLTALYQMAHDLLVAATLDQAVEAIVRHVQISLEATIAVLLADSSGRLSYHAHPASSYDIAGPEQPVADWVFEHSQVAGRFTRNQGQAEALFVPLVVQARAIGVIALKWRENCTPTSEQANLLNEWAMDIAIALGRLQEQFDQLTAQA